MVRDPFESATNQGAERVTGSRGGVHIVLTAVLVLAGLVLLDMVLFRNGMFWELPVQFPPGLEGTNQRFLYGMAKEFESGTPGEDVTVVVGSSVVAMGVDEAGIRRALAEAGVRTRFLRLLTYGSTCTDTALLTWNARSFRPRTVVYLAAARDFPKERVRGSAAQHVFYDASFGVQVAAEPGGAARLDAILREYWKLYRYRSFGRMVLLAAWSDLFAGPASASAPNSMAAPKPLPKEALEIFGPLWVTPENFVIWQEWRHSRLFSDYARWMNAASKTMLNVYATQTIPNFGPEGNPHVESLQWMLDDLQASGTRIVVAYSPENPVFRDPEAGAYFDPALSDAWAGVLARETTAHGGRFEDLRNLLAPEDFLDLVHPNVVGMRKISTRIAAILVEEARRHPPGS